MNNYIKTARTGLTCIINNLQRNKLNINQLKKIATKNNYKFYGHEIGIHEQPHTNTTIILYYFRRIVVDHTNKKLTIYRPFGGPVDKVINLS